MAEQSDKPRSGPGSRPRRLLVIDSSYHLSAIRSLDLSQPVIARDLDGFFDHVWSVNPFGDPELGSGDSGKAEWVDFAPRHTFIQAHHGRFARLARLWPLNFLLGQFALLASLIALVRRQDIQIVRAGDPLYLGLLGWLVARLGGAAFAIRVNGNNDKVRATTGALIYPRLLRSLKVEKTLERFTLGRAELVAAPNQDNVDFALANGALPGRTAIFPYGNLLSPKHLQEPKERILDPAVFEQFGVEPGNYILGVCRLKPLKFPDDVIKAFAAACGAGFTGKLILAGVGEMKDELIALAAGLGVSHRCFFAGNLNQHQLAQLYLRANAVISPLTGRALSEAALGAAPIAAYDLDWQSDLISTGESGILVPFRDVEALGRATIKLIREPAYARRMGEGARRRALSMFDPAAMLKNERERYSRMLGSPAVKAEAHKRIDLFIPGIALTLWLITLWTLWPGEFIGDNLRQLREIRAGEVSDWHSPLHTLIWSLFGGAKEPLLALQTGTYWLGFALLGRALASRSNVRLGLAVIAVGLTPLSLLYLGRTQKDTMLVAFLLVAAGLLANGRWRTSIVPSLLGMLLRANAVFAVAPLLIRSKSTIKGLVYGALLGVALIPVSRFVNYQLLGASHSNVERSLQLFDLAGIEHFSGRSDPQLRLKECYTPFWWDKLEIDCQAFTNAPDDLGKRWVTAIAAEPVAYAWHRLRAFNANIYFLVPPRQECVADAKNNDCPKVANAMLRDALERNPFFWPVTWLAVGSAMLFLRSDPFVRTLLISGLLYGYAYLIVGVAAGFRYFYWTEMAVQIALVWHAATVGLRDWKLLAAVVASVWTAGLAFRYLPLLF